MAMEMVSCGGCKRCLAGAKIHGPYPYRYTGSGSKRQHLYGGGKGGSKTANPADEERMRDEAEREYEELERSLTPAQQKKLDDVMGRLAQIRRVSREGKREVERRTHEAREKGLTQRVVERIAAEIGQQVEAELDELKKQLTTERKELKKMLKRSK